MFKVAVIWALFSGAMMMGNVAIPAEKSLGRTEPPMKYQLEDVKISVLYQTAHRIPGSYKVIINGNGMASYVLDKKEKTELILKDKELVDLLNDFYQLHFFELQDTYTVKRQIALLDDHTISTFFSRLVDMGSKQICITLANYKKCITMMDKQPVVANQLINKIENLLK